MGTRAMHQADGLGAVPQFDERGGMPHAFEGVFDSRPHPHGQPFVPFDFGDDTYTPGKIYSIRRREHGHDASTSPGTAFAFPATDGLDFADDWQRGAPAGAAMQAAKMKREMERCEEARFSPDRSPPPQSDSELVMELKIPRFVVEAVFPNLAFNDAALSAAIRVDQAVLRYDVARETFIIRGGSMSDIKMCKAYITSEMHGHGFNLQIEDPTPVQPPRKTSPNPPVKPAPSKPQAATRRQGSASLAPPRLISRQHRNGVASEGRTDGGGGTSEQVIWVEHDGRKVMMKVEEDSDDSASDDELYDSNTVEGEGVQHKGVYPAAPKATKLTEAEDIIREQTLEMEKLALRVERQALLLEDRLEAEADLRKENKLQRELIEKLEAGAAALHSEQESLKQAMRIVVSERDQARTDHRGAMLEAASSHAMLQDAGRYIEHLRNDIAVLTMNLHASREETKTFAEAAAHAHHTAQELKAKGSTGESDGFAMSHITASIQEAVKEVQGLPEDERKKQVKALRLRWHPDKNPILKEFATEVSKVLNAAVTAMEEAIAKEKAAADSQADAAADASEE